MADEDLRRLVHGLGIERAEHAPGAHAFERERAAPVDDAIEIMARLRRETRVEVVRQTCSQAKTEIGSGRTPRSAHRGPCRRPNPCARSKWAT